MYVEVIPSKACNIETLTYSVPEEFYESVSIGGVVQIPFRKGFMFGLVIKILEEKPEFKTRAIWHVSEIKINKERIEIIKWISKYYFCSLCTAAKLFLPERIWNRRKKLPETEEHPEQNATEKKHNELKLHERKCNFTDSQKKVFDDIRKSKKLLHLLHGVTGSGKTEIYLHLIHEQLEKGKQSLILLPEISLTPQIQNYFENAFEKEIVSVMHSGQTLKERTESWLKVYAGKTKILIGARSALFAPFKDLGIIVIDESHDQSFKQDSSPRYNAKRVAAEIAKLQNIKVIYGSATPNAETYYSAEKKDSQIELHHIDEKIAKDSRRFVYMVDMKDEWKKKNFSIFSELLVDKIGEKLDKKEQIILFVNRRGSASAMICRDCGNKETCVNCSILLTYHKSRYANTLQCHHCGAVKVSPNFCPKCRGGNFKLTGLGTEKVEAEIAQQFPNAKTIRADSDTTQSAGGIKQIYETFKSHKADILIGTQMIAKGWDIPNVTLVGIVLADIGLNIPDFRSGERIFQLLTQVAGRTARADKHGDVIIQTYNPENPTILAAAKDDFHEFYENEIADRKKFSFPPFSKIIKLTVSDKNQKTCIKKAEELSKKLEEKKSSDKTVKIFLAPDYIAFKGGKYHYNVFLQGVAPDKAFHGIEKGELKDLRIDRI